MVVNQDDSKQVAHCIAAIVESEEFEESLDNAARDANWDLEGRKLISIYDSFT
jgi:hypothetical protein